MPGEKWIARHTNDNFWLEASFLTLWGAERSLRRARFVRSLHDFNGFRSYLKFWSSEVYAVARIRPKTSRTGRGQGYRLLLRWPGQQIPEVGVTRRFIQNYSISRASCRRWSGECTCSIAGWMKAHAAKVGRDKERIAVPHEIMAARAAGALYNVETVVSRRSMETCAAPDRLTQRELKSPMIASPGANDCKPLQVPGSP